MDSAVSTACDIGFRSAAAGSGKPAGQIFFETALVGPLDNGLLVQAVLGGLSQLAQNRGIHWGDLEIGHTVLTQPASSEGQYDNLPGGVCPCPRYGYVFKGTVRCVYWFSWFGV